MDLPPTPYACFRTSTFWIGRLMRIRGFGPNSRSVRLKVPKRFLPCTHRRRRLVRFNEALLNDPSLINADNYDKGWLYEFSTTLPLLSPEDYIKVLEAGWKHTERLLKNQFNE